MVTTRLEKAFTLFDTYNLQDPNSITCDGVTYPYAYFHALQVHDWINKLTPQSGEALLLASRSQHIGRWQIPREQYPKTRAGYLTWRRDLSLFHAATAGALLKEAGYNEDEIEMVQRIIRKENIRTDADVQVMEDALCLVFLQWQYDAFLTQHDEEKVIRILQKTWRKMSAAGRAAALQLTYSSEAYGLLQRALG